MAIQRSGGKREQNRRAAETVRGLVEGAQSEIARYRAELRDLIKAGLVHPVFGLVAKEDFGKEELFGAWQAAQRHSDALGLFVAICRERIAELRRTMPNVVELAERLHGVKANGALGHPPKPGQEVRYLMRLLRAMDNRNGDLES